MRAMLGPADLQEGTMRGVAAPDGRLILVARVGDRLHAIDDVCNHAGCLLSEGTLSGALVECPCHGMTFDVRTGELRSGEPLCEDQRAFPVAVEAGTLYVELPGGEGT